MTTLQEKLRADGDILCVTAADTIDQLDKAQVELRQQILRLKNYNSYDRTDRVRRLGVIFAGPVKLGAYQVRDPETDDWSPIQFHLTYDNTVMGVMSAEAAKMFSTFVKMTLDRQENSTDKPHKGKIYNWSKYYSPVSFSEASSSIPLNLGFVIRGRVVEDSNHPKDSIRTSLVVRWGPDGEIETLNSRYTLVGQEV